MGNPDLYVWYFLFTQALNNLFSATSSDGNRLLPLALDIGFWARFADALAIGSCKPLPSAFVNGT
jgi:hypothetical protein